MPVQKPASFTLRESVRTDPYLTVQRRTFTPMTNPFEVFSFDLMTPVGERTARTTGSDFQGAIGPAWEITVVINPVVDGVSCGLFVHLRTVYNGGSNPQLGTFPQIQDDGRWLIGGFLDDGLVVGAGGGGSPLRVSGVSQGEVLTCILDYDDAANAGRLNVAAYFSVQNLPRS